MSNQSSIQALESNIKLSREMADVGAAMERLRSNRDFKKVIVEGYFEKEAVRLVHLKADPNMQDADSQVSILKQMDAIGSLKQYFRVVDMKAGQAVHAIAADEETVTELMQEEVQ